jgi:hypothetical protein
LKRALLVTIEHAPLSEKRVWKTKKGSKKELYQIQILNEKQSFKII